MPIPARDPGPEPARGRSDPMDGREARGAGVAIGAALGLLIGIGIGNPAAGLGVGVALGAALELAARRRTGGGVR